MLAHRRWESLDAADLGWLRAKYHFQINAAGNPEHQALGSLIVWNDDEIAVGSGFPLHGRREVEIITYVRQGVLWHRDTLGYEGTIHAGDIQVISAGTGIRHAEFNKAIFSYASSIRSAPILNQVRLCEGTPAHEPVATFVMGRHPQPFAPRVRQHVTLNDRNGSGHSRCLHLSKVTPSGPQVRCK
jgi:hypothetical protein